MRARILPSCRRRALRGAARRRIEPMQRVLVMGSSGSGKSTFARRLSDVTGLPFVSLDALFWKPGWVASDNAEFGQRVAEVARQPQWVMDGNFTNHGAGELRRHS